MKIWSKGLGKIELVMDFSKYNVRREGDEIFIEGIITDPVYWDFRITMTEDDLPGLMHVAVNRTMIGMILGNIGKVFAFFAGALGRFFRRGGPPGQPEKVNPGESEKKE